jgi:hypothetical protein
VVSALAELGCKFAPSAYYQARDRKPSARAVRDEQLKQLIVAEYDEMAERSARAGRDRQQRRLVQQQAPLRILRRHSADEI